jgi:hypothetical protein
MLEDDHKLQEAVLSVHHALIHTLSATGAFKIIENHNGVAFIQVAQPVMIQGPAGIKLPAGGLGIEQPGALSGIDSTK